MLFWFCHIIRIRLLPDYRFMYITGFCLLPHSFLMLWLRYGESSSCSPSNSHLPFSCSHSVRYHLKGLNTPTMYPVITSYSIHYTKLYEKTWKHFLEVLKVDYNCSLADVCRDQHTTFGGMSSWMSRRGYSVKQAKADVVRDYYGGVEPSQPTTSSPSFTQIAPASYNFV